MSSLPREINHVLVPPIKCQGIKTKLVPFIAANIRWTGRGRWIEPFLGSGVVAFNIQPERALLNDSNPHIIALYQQIYVGKLTSRQVSEHLSREGAELLAKGDEHYYFVRERFNRTTDPLDFLFLNRSCFNGVMRFNRKGQFNTPFCRKPERFRRALITKIANQVTDLARVMHNKQWEFRVGAWQSCLQEICRDDFIYLDPPYIGRHADYFDSWNEQDAIDLASVAQTLPAGFALSMWKENKYRRNEHLDLFWRGNVQRTINHFYHVGPAESLRNEMEEVLIIRQDFAADAFASETKSKQLAMSIGA
ncbi:Dam family site-specific DNA-(adenine-N6)-methyltransferase [Anaerolineae bacterium CFX7]|nr:Dam family site-specific DNA-(adenine-N6)-methyltransferase [Anaerolineae bacterium CFX7]